MIRAYIFDFDYTLGDSTEGIAQSINYALLELGHEKREEQEIRKTIGYSLEETYTMLTQDSTEENRQKFSYYFKKEADKIMVENTVCLPQVIDTLLELKKLGMQLGIVTTKYHYRIEQILDAWNQQDLINEIIGCEDVTVPKPDPEGLLNMVQKLGLRKEQVIYIGDSIVDAETANLAGISFIGVTTGTTTREKLELYPNKRIIQGLGELIF